MFSSPLKDSVIVLIILLLFFGPKRLPALSRSIGESIKEFRGGINEAKADKTLSEAPSVTAPAASAAPAEEVPAATRSTAGENPAQQAPRA